MSKKIYDSVTNSKSEFKRSSKKFKYSKKTPQINKQELYYNYQKQLAGSNDLMKYQKILKNSQYIRFNTHLMEEDKIYELLTKDFRVKLEKTFIPQCYKIIRSHFPLSGSFPVLSGLCYLQDMASQLPLHCIDFSKYKNNRINREIKILDMCSSPGSKTTQLINILEENNISAQIVANDNDSARITKLVNNVQKTKSTNISIISQDAQSLKLQKNSFDIVLLDAPCSGNFIQERNWFSKRNAKGVLKNAQTQKQLLEKAVELCRVGGVVSYSTCSMEIEENELNVVYALKNLSLKTQDTTSNMKFKIPFEVKSINIVKNVENKKLLRNSLRLHPPYSNTQGFFITIFEKV